jgi:hypothetical protein
MTESMDSLENLKDEELVRLSRKGTRTIDFLASSVALRMASGTSRALPWPKPTRPR